LKEQLRSLRIERDAAIPAAPPRPARRWGRVVAVLTALLLASIAGYRAVASRPLAVRVVYAQVEEGDRAFQGPVLSGAGYLITAEKYIAIGVRVPGRIERFLVDEGDRVEPGQLLVELDARDYRAQVGRAEAALRLARANLKLAEADAARIRRLFEQGVTSRQELDQVESRREVAAASVAEASNALAEARANLDDTRLLSPVRGVVLARLRGVGEIAVPGGFAGSGDLLRLADLSELRAEVDVSEADIANVQRGQDAEVVPDAYPQRRYRAEVVKIYPQVNRQKGTLKVEVRIEDPDELLLPDMSVRITFFARAPASTAGGGKRVVWIPQAALRQGSNGAYAWVVSRGRLTRERLEVEPPIGDRVSVTSGLAGGEALVVGPEGALREGVAVEVLAGA
jgi:RND family efflux transporter MFP subunit